VSAGAYPVLLVAEGGANFRVQVTNRDTFVANTPKRGDTVTLIGKVDNFGTGKPPLNFRGLLLPK
jgi:hypothetical protein